MTKDKEYRPLRRRRVGRAIKGLRRLGRDNKPKRVVPAIEVETDRGRHELFATWKAAEAFAQDAAFAVRGDRVELITRHSAPLSKMLLVWDRFGMLKRSILLHEV